VINNKSTKGLRIGSLLTASILQVPKILFPKLLFKYATTAIIILSKITVGCSINKGMPFSMMRKLETLL
jgi:hypothetical protein